MSEYQHICYIDNGSTCDRAGRIIENPAILLDKETGCVHGWGEAENVTAKMAYMAAAYNQAGFPEDAGNLMMLDFSDASFKGVTNEEICYVLRRAVEYTATSFQPALCEHAMEPGFLEWLRTEMRRLPIDLTKRYDG